MFAKVIALFALIAVAFAAPKPEPSPQLLAYSSGLDFVNPYAAYPGYAGYAAAPYVANPLAYSGYPYAAYYKR